MSESPVCYREPGSPGPTAMAPASPPTYSFKAGSEAQVILGEGLRVSPPSTGSLIQVPMSEKGKITRGRLGSLSLKKEGERQCFLFSKHLIICTRGSGGKLHLTKVRPGLGSCWGWRSDTTVTRGFRPTLTRAQTVGRGVRDTQVYTHTH